jgi:hypothetical protein
MRGFGWYWRLVTILLWAAVVASMVGLIFEFMMGPTVVEWQLQPRLLLPG